MSKSSLNIAVLTVSDSRTFDNDTSGRYLAEVLQKAGHNLHDSGIVKDNIYQIRAWVSAWIAEPGVHVILMTGGTGFSGRDSTPEAVLPLLDKTVDGFGELFRQISYEEIGTSTIQSRAIAGLANNTLVFCMPGSTGACKTAWDGIIREQLDQAHQPCNFVGTLIGTHSGPSHG